jgi:hypothetical protein
MVGCQEVRCEHGHERRRPHSTLSSVNQWEKGSTRVDVHHLLVGDVSLDKRLDQAYDAERGEAGAPFVEEARDRPFQMKAGHIGRFAVPWAYSMPLHYRSYVEIALSDLGHLLTAIHLVKRPACALSVSGSHLGATRGPCLWMNTVKYLEAMGGVEKSRKNIR